MTRTRKFSYYKVIQECWEGQWCDADFHACDSTGYMPAADRKLFQGNLKAYRENSQASGVRVIRRRELNQETQHA